MKKALVLLISVILFVVIVSFSSPKVEAYSVRVSGYTRSNGTYVQPYYRTNSNSTKYDNYSYKGNTNPYTGKIGTRY